ncbi:MAG: enoyl-CoA hydratase-related protein [Rhodobacteraceae bacterium]|nr:enoyl-CoA hydratase-related protein [Paracoccaceae bacterium]
MIDVAVEDAIVVITLNRPEVMNALNAEMRAELTHALRVVSPYARVVVIRGSGDAFCTGQDLGEDIKVVDADLERVLRDEYVPLLRAVSNCHAPTIAAVNGPAAGAGANLALSADVVIARESAYFFQAFVAIGLMPDAGGTWMLPRQMGMAKSMGAALFGDRISAVDASNWGMIWEAVPDDLFEEHWKSRAAQLAAGPTQAYRNIRKAIRSAYGNSYEEHLLLEARLQGGLGKTRDFKEGLLAFSEKRPPVFEGR